EAVWQTGPVAFETCWDMRKWKDSGWDLHYIFDYALRCHGSYVNNKSAPLPEGTRAEVERLLRKLGYRLTIRRLEHAASAHPGGDLDLGVDWENLGVAPPYRDYRVAVRIKPRDVAPAKALVIPTNESIRGWVPGERSLKIVLRIPESVWSGSYEFAVGIVQPGTTTAEVRLAIQGRDNDGWYPLSRIEISK